MRNTYSKSLSRTVDSGCVRYPGRNVALKPGPTTSSVDFGKREGSPRYLVRRVVGGYGLKPEY
jgi:hypothetical protein